MFLFGNKNLKINFYGLKVIENGILIMGYLKLNRGKDVWKQYLFIDDDVKNDKMVVIS